MQAANEAGTHQIVLVIDDDVMITEGLAAGLARTGRTVVTCNDLASAELTTDWLKPSHVVCDVKLSGKFGYEGLDFIHYVKRQSPDTRTILITGDGPDALQLEASERGAVGFLCKPFEIDELDALLNLMAPPRVGSPDWPDIMHVPTLDDILSKDLLSSVFQPIVRLPSGEHIGYEALARCQTDSLMRNPETLFRYANRQLRVTDLELACIRSSLQKARHLPDWAPLFVNVHPAAFASGKVLEEWVVSQSARTGIAMNRLVLEITEQESLSTDSTVMFGILALKAAGIRFAFDDVGVAYSHLSLIDKIRPSFLKISQEFGGGFEGDSTKTKIVRNLLSLAKDFDCELILEGIETAETARAATELGIKFAQGYYFARPAPAETFNLSLSQERARSTS